MSNVAAMIMTFLEARRSSETRGIAPGNLPRGVVALAAALSVLGGAGWGADGPSDDGAADSVSGAQSPEGSGLDPEKAGWEVPRKRTPRAPEDDRPFPEVGERQFGLGTAAMHLDFVHAREPVRSTWRGEGPRAPSIARAPRGWSRGSGPERRARVSGRSAPACHPVGSETRPTKRSVPVLSRITKRKG